MNSKLLSLEEKHALLVIGYLKSMPINGLCHTLEIDKEKSRAIANSLLEMKNIILQNDCISLSEERKVEDLIRNYELSSYEGIPTYVGLILMSYEIDICTAAYKAVKAYDGLIYNTWGDTAIYYFYHLCVRLLLETKVSMQNNEQTADFIQNVCTLYLHNSIFPFNIGKGLVLLFKAKALAFATKNQRAIIIIQVLLVTVTAPFPLNHRTALIRKKSYPVLNYVQQNVDAELNSMLKLHVATHIFYEGRLLECFQYSMSGLSQCDKNSHPRVVSQLYSISLASGFYLGEYNLFGNIKHASDLNYGLSLLLIYGIRNLLFGNKKAFNKSILQLIRSSSAALKYRKIWKSFLFCYYFSQQKMGSHLEIVYRKQLAPFIKEKIYYGEHVMGSYFLDILLHVFLYTRSEEDQSILNNFFQIYLEGCRKIHKCSALRNYGVFIYEIYPEQQEKALSYLLQSYAMTCEFSFIYEQYLCALNLVRIYMGTKHFAEVIFYVQQAYGLSEKYGFAPFPEDLLLYVKKGFVAEKRSKNKKRELFITIRQQLKKINLWSNVDEYIRLVVCEVTSNLGVLKAAHMSKLNEKIIPYGGVVIEKEKSSSKDIVDCLKYSFNQKRNNIKTYNDTNMFCQIVVYLNLEPYDELCVYIEGKLFSHIAEILDGFFLEELAHCMEDYINTVYMCENRNTLRQKAIVSSSPNSVEGQFLYKSHIMLNLLKDAEQVAQTDASILITGESGVGKEILAKKIHADSKKNGVFVPVNLANIPESLYESELHGYEKGSFTNAIKQHIGFFELADGGTLFIDEVGEIPLPLQVKLLRVLQEKKFTRVGGTKLIYSDFRLITATNRDLIQEVAQNNFREDLYYRLNVIPIHVPPLRARKDDIIFLALHFLNSFSFKHNKPVYELTHDDREALLNYSWPGNIRELKNIIERYVLLSNKENKLLLQNLISATPILEVPTVHNSSFPFCLEELFTGFPTIRELEKQYLEFLFIQTHGKIDGENSMSAILKLSRQQIYNKINAAGIKEKYEKRYIKK